MYPFQALRRTILLIAEGPRQLYDDIEAEEILQRASTIANATSAIPRHKL